MEVSNYYKEFAKSNVHIATIVGLAGAFALASPLALVAAGTAYALTWVYFPTSHFFVRRVADRLKLAEEASKKNELAAFVERRDALVSKLEPANREKYAELASVCGEVSSINPDNGIVNGKLQELLWTYLKMLTMEQGIRGYLAETDEGDLDRSLESVDREIGNIPAEKARLRESKENLRQTLSQHKKSIAAARENQQVLESDIARLEHEIQMLRADAVANRNGEFLSARINASVESLQESKAILQTMNNVEEMLLDVPSNVAAIGFEAPVPQEEAPVAEQKPSSRRKVGN